MIQQLYGFLIALAVGVIVALVGYFLNIRAANSERKGRAKEHLRGAMHSILVELETNLKVAKQPFTGRLVPFATEMWDYHKGGILELPKDTQTALHQVYIWVREANALVQSNLQLSYGLGYYNNEYQKKCTEIAKGAEEAIELLRSWLE